ncbi:MAG: FAD-dependent oxidoreductase [Alphaproteobacteria bacterium]|nr:FAD-dependent oxidoreductase [Alphaproteobacteria bacterium]
MTVESVVIVGAGQSGGRTAALLRQEGFEGDICLIGAEPHAPYERPPLSKAVLKGEKDASHCFLYDAAFYDDNRITLKTGTRVEAIDTTAGTVSLSDGSVLPYGALVLATGGVVKRLPLPGADLKGIHVVRTLEDSAELGADLTPGARVAVIGGGFIGLETAASARQMGCDVTVLEGAPRILGRSVPQEVADVVARLHTDNGVKIDLNVRIAGFEGKDGKVTAIRFQDGSEMPCDVVVIGIGIAPGVDLAEAAGIPCEDGILVDEFGATRVAGVYATGDCARAVNPHYGEAIRLESWQNADMQARAVARSICGKPEAYAPVPWLWSDQYDWTLQTAGLPGKCDTVVTRGSYEDGAVIFFTFEKGTLTGVAGFGQVSAIAKDVKVAQMMMERGVNPDPGLLADTAMPLRKIMKAA